MAEPKFTPGPWRVGGYMAVRGHTATIEAGEGPTFTCIATVFPEHDAENSRLIAAAPKMYEALEKLLRRYGVHSNSDIKYAADALAEAQGKFNLEEDD